MVKTIIKYTFILYTFGIICVDILFHACSQNLKSLTLTKSNVRSNMKRREYCSFIYLFHVTFTGPIQYMTLNSDSDS
jgi:hypothetical protein